MPKSVKTVEPSPLRDLIGFLLLSVGVFSFLALATYNPSDPSLNTVIASDHPVVRNLCGVVGSYFSDLLIQLLGYGAYFVPLALVGSSVALVFRPTLLQAGGRIAGFVLLALSFTTVLSLFEGDRVHVPAWGGIMGVLVRSGLREYLGAAGAWIFAFFLLSISLVLSVNLRFRAFLATLRNASTSAFRFRKVFIVAYERLGEAVDAVVAKEEKEFRRGLDEIRKGSAPSLPKIEKLKIAGQEVAPVNEEPISAPPSANEKLTLAEAEDSPEERRPEIPIVTLTSRETASLPKFHSMESDGPDEQRPKIRKDLKAYKLPDAALLDAPEDRSIPIDRNELFENAQTLERKLKDFGVFGKVVEVQPGPVVTMYEFEPAPGVKVNQITRLNDDLALALKAVSVRITPIPGKAVIGIEVSNRDRQVVYLKEIIENDIFSQSASKLTLALGKDISGIPVVTDLRRMPHLLVAGATGSGKSVAINSMILSLIYKSTPHEVRMILVDPKMLELSLYDDIPHLLLPVVTDPRKAAVALRWAVSEMERRYRLMADLGVRNIEGYNKKVDKVAGRAPSAVNEDSLFPVSPEKAEGEKEIHTGSLPYLVIVIDELADLMMVSSREVEESIIRLAQMARASGIHLLLATQRPSVDVITGVIKANMPARISFQVSSKIDSRTILDANGAELLLGAGDMLFLPPGTSKLERVHGAFVTDNEVKRVTDFWKKQGQPDYNLDIVKIQAEAEESMLDGEGGEDEDMYRQALNVVRAHRVASISMIQRKLRIGYNRAARIVERMEEEGLLAPGEVGKPREVILSRLDVL